MNLRILLPVAFAGAAFLFTACGDGPDTPATTATPGAPGVTGTAGIPEDFGPAPVLGGNITSITPEHAAKVTQASTRTVNLGDPKGICAQVTFDGLPQYAQWFRMAVDGVEVTEELLWIVPTREAPTTGKVCFVPEAGLAVGKHTAAIAVQDPNNPLAESKQVVGWAFEVTP